MLILAIDSSSQSGSVAFIRNGKMIGEFFINDQLTHSITLMPMLEKLKEILDINLSELSAVAVSTGPGSFTGLRIGISSAKAICQALNVPIIGINTLDVLAHSVPIISNKIICPILDARKNQVYTASYIFKNNELLKLTDYIATDLNEILDKFIEDKREVYFIGDGVSVYKNKIIERLGENATFAPIFIQYTRASVLAQIAECKYIKSEIENPDYLVPTYIRKPQAEIEHDN
ncbi:tRNA (adenosine(37)-N6)-threonylcarbamoyltransferase complex dimerization subunit type 1 TsaB [Candidatus Epulonipiscioides gigas]|nr:tRNA (adenosine(37)-N6)-threonylcarbamoyltransferase complex dimerization subunit type 1 TsaB [Epulopiscium sp. SCG-C07WGA-EpuloA2]